MTYPKHTLCFVLAFLLSALFIGSCANQGAPEGGPYDTQPPRLLQANPSNKATGVRSRRLVLNFDEYIKLSSDQDKIIVSPAQLKPARITTSGHSVIIYLEDSLRPATTYSFYFDDAISDNNEDNALEDFSYLFSTGDKVDSMQVSGRVVDALTYEPIGDLLIGAYHPGQMSDSTLAQRTFPYVSKSNKMGRFTLRGLPDSTYLVFATKDNDRNYRYNEPSEGLAFSAKHYRTSLKDSLRTDTLRIDSIVRRDTLHRDSLITRPYTYYYPQDVALRYSVPTIVRKGIERHSRVDNLLCRIEFLSPTGSFPVIRSLDKPSAPATQLYVASMKGRTLDLWLRDAELIAGDSVRFVLSYERSDSLQRVALHTDTLSFLKPRLRTPRTKKGEVEKSPLQLLASGATGLRAQSLEDSLKITASRPLAQLPKEALRLTVTVDSTTKPLDFTLVQDSLDRLSYSLHFARGYGQQYQLKLDSAAVRDIYGAAADSVSFSQSTLAEQELGQLSVQLRGIREHALVQLLDKSDAVIAQTKALPASAKSAQPTATQAKASPAPQSEASDAVLQQLLSKQRQQARGAADSLSQRPKEASRDSLTQQTKAAASDSLGHLQVRFKDLKPGEYYLRLIVDADGDGAFTPGDYPRQPEEVYYCPQTFAIKKGFTTEEQWDIRATDPMESKPQELRKVKPNTAKKQRIDKNIEYYKRWGKGGKANPQPQLAQPR
ncbi:Ig-like domain-containing protein [Porphyromonas sp.]